MKKMKLIDKNLPATPNQLRIFGVLLAAFFGLIGGLVLYHTSSWPLAALIWSIALVLCTFYYAVRSSQYLIFQIWMTVVYPIGWFISHLLLAIIFFLVITPISMIMALVGHDPLQREWSLSAPTYWTPVRQSKKVQRYFDLF